MASVRSLKRGFVIKLIFCDHSTNIRVNVITVFLGLLCMSGSLYGLKHWYDGQIAAYNARLAELEKSNSQYRSALALKERENQQIAMLAEDRFEDLCTQIENQDNAIKNINETVGKKSAKSRRSLRGSRSGVRHVCLDLKLKYKSLIDDVHNRKADINQLRVAAKSYRKELERKRLAASLSKTPSLWPVRGEISSDFGTRVHPVYGYSRFHSGLDIAAPSGSVIVATAAGRVTEAGWLQGYGYAVEVDHGNNLKTLYGHCSELLVRVGDNVRRGQSIALVGSTGVSTGPHCHYEVMRGGVPINPVPYLASH